MFKSIQPVIDALKLLSVRFYNKTGVKPGININNLNQNAALDGISQQVHYLKYIGISNAKDYNTEKCKIKYSDFFPITDPRILKRTIAEVDIPDFATLINFLYTYNTRAPTNNVLSCINIIERETCAKLHVMDSKTIFNILFGYMYVIPGFTNQLKFYTDAMMKLSNEIDTLTKEHLVQYSFYLGLMKSSNPEFANIHKNVLLVLSDKYLQDLTINDLCIVTNATFKMSIKINSLDFLNKICGTLVEGLSQNGLELPQIITLLKSLRLARYTSVELLEALSQYTENNMDKLNVTAISHILPYYADNYYIDENSLNLLVDKFIIDVKQHKSTEVDIYETNNVRAKDLSRFLWSLSYLGWSMDKNTYEELENTVLDKITNGDYKNNIDDLPNICLSFCTLNYMPTRLLRIALAERNMKSKSSTNRSEERRRLLMSILNIEYSEIFKDLPHLLKYWNEIKDSYTEPMTSNRKNLQTVLNVLRSNDVGLSDIELQCQIPFLNTPGICATIDKNNTKVHIEVLDESVCIKNLGSTPNGVMALKIRLLKNVSNNAVVVINKEDVENQDEEYIKARVQQLCSFL